MPAPVNKASYRRSPPACGHRLEPATRIGIEVAVSRAPGRYLVRRIRSPEATWLPRLESASAATLSHAVSISQAHWFARASVRAQALFNPLRVLTQVEYGHNDHTRGFHGIENTVRVVGHQ